MSFLIGFFAGCVIFSAGFFCGAWWCSSRQCEQCADWWLDE